MILGLIYEGCVPLRGAREYCNAEGSTSAEGWGVNLAFEGQADVRRVRPDAFEGLLFCGIWVVNQLAWKMLRKADFSVGIWLLML
ncbi:hypothetical protein Nepgr_028312 [Nepenthes gracilis]|uniref:Uncharacterized protein n=1 Tax=Nepenthes gracilis TaxID=150966 RepID=A0AAD3TC02_NEPGR|nr:hypothetical protein Nepgr_028312 [Nepenthes gracilis]